MKTSECLKDTYKILTGEEISDKNVDTTCEIIHEINKVLPNSVGGCVVVDELPTTDIKPNVIYALKESNINGYTYCYGTRFPILTIDNFESIGNQMIQILSSNGWEESELKQVGILLSFGYLSSNIILIENDTVVIRAINLFDKDTNKYVLDHFFYDVDGKGTNTSISKTFNTINDLSNYLLGGNYVNDITEQSVEAGSELSPIVTIANNHGFKYSTSPLADTEVGVAYLDESTYKYYIYDGKEWIALKDDVVVKSLTVTDSSGTLKELLESITFTTEEFERLYNGANLLIQISGEKSSVGINSLCLAKNNSKTHLVFNETDYRGLEYTYYYNEFFTDERYSFTVAATSDSDTINVSVSLMAKVYQGDITIETGKWYDIIETGQFAAYRNSGYSYYATISGRVGSGMTNLPNIILSPNAGDEASITTMTSGNVCMYGYCIDGAATIFAKELPSATLKLKYICIE